MCIQMCKYYHDHTCSSVIVYRDNKVNDENITISILSYISAGHGYKVWS